MAWVPISLNFRQSYGIAYDFCDVIGKVMSNAERKFNLFPDNIKPSSCRLISPEEFLSVSIDESELTVCKEFVTDRDSAFLKFCADFSYFLTDLVRPDSIQANLFGRKSYIQAKTADESRQLSISLIGGVHKDLESILDMPECEEGMNCSFSSGKTEFTLEIRSVNIKLPAVQKTPITPLMTKAQKGKIERLNKRSEKLSSFTHSHGVLMTTELQELDPPIIEDKCGIERLYNDLSKKEIVLQNRYKL